ncbi:hypothetical protein SAMN05216241_101547 [Limimonas halophila]|uniref:Uncharacterized protein n=1 Tax=Limimonas halophila TaxID=1082479 RepID=A0A1G7MCK8_9PROT|nr:hypothetical protein [Limimonas halophila]SDF58949.1 hypothetical protein SAMN05216241_101547 [Limimonas halophila]
MTTHTAPTRARYPADHALVRSSMTPPMRFLPEKAAKPMRAARANHGKIPSSGRNLTINQELALLLEFLLAQPIDQFVFSTYDISEREAENPRNVISGIRRALARLGFDITDYVAIVVDQSQHVQSPHIHIVWGIEATPAALTAFNKVGQRRHVTRSSSKSHNQPTDNNRGGLPGLLWGYFRAARNLGKTPAEQARKGAVMISQGWRRAIQAVARTGFRADLHDASTGLPLGAEAPATTPAKPRVGLPPATGHKPAPAPSAAHPAADAGTADHPPAATPADAPAGEIAVGADFSPAETRCVPGAGMTAPKPRISPSGHARARKRYPAAWPSPEAPSPRPLPDPRWTIRRARIPVGAGGSFPPIAKSGRSPPA